MRTKPFFVLVIVVAAVLVAIVVSGPPRVEAGINGGTPAPVWNAILVPVPPLRASVPCGASVSLAQFTYWPQNAEGKYVARFFAVGGSADSTVTLETNMGSALLTVPAGAQLTPYSLYLATVRPPAQAPVFIEIRAAQGACSRTAGRPGHPLQVSDLNLFGTAADTLQLP